jgi:nucleoside-diphosphate-sugar epimerase
MGHVHPALRGDTSMKILITGNMGYIGPCVVRHLRQSRPEATLIGLDAGFFASCLTSSDVFPECRVDLQYFADVRRLPGDVLNGVDAVVHLAAISNDPMGKAFEEVTLDVNYRASINLAKKAKEAGVRSYVFASSCSMYGAAEDTARTEESPLNPLTAYARSKVLTERDLRQVAGDGFKVTSLRFATACGMSDRLRLDLVLNDFVAGAIASKRISILSDGTPWRPLINAKDMARAIEWAINRDVENGGRFLAVNVGANEWNYQVKDLAEAVAQIILGIDISVNKDAQPDKRSYRVNFDLFKSLAPNHLPQCDLLSTIAELRDGLAAMDFADEDFRNSRFIRLNVLKNMQKTGLLTEKLEWTANYRP